MSDSGRDDADVGYMRRAIELAYQGLYTTDPNPRVGCVLVRDEAIVGEGWHVQAGEGHAEINALDAAGGGADGATAYVTLEPCSHTGRTGPCCEALVAAGISRVVAAGTDPNPQVAGRGLAYLREHGVEVRCGVLEEKAEAINPGYFSRRRRGRPYVRVKSAMSLDGRTALANGDSRWITGPAARHDVHRYRARSACMVTGIGTVIADDPALTARLDRPVVQPSVVVMDRTLRCPLDATVLSHAGGCSVVYIDDGSAQLAARAQALRATGVDLVALDSTDSPAMLKIVLAELAQREVNEVMVEAGPTLAGAWLQSGWVDEWVLYVAPCVLGPDARALADWPRLDDMADRGRWRRKYLSTLEDDVKLVFLPDDAPCSLA